MSVVHPQIEVKTADARAILRQQVPLKNAIKQWGNIAGLVTGILKNDLALISRSLEDHIIEPIRSTLIPGFQEIKTNCKQAGALGGGISGSGPSIFMLSSSRSTAEAVQQIMQQTYIKLGIDYHSYVSMINKEGVRIEEVED